MTEAPPPPESMRLLQLPDGSIIELPRALYESLLREAARFGVKGERETLELLEDRLGRLAPEFVRELKRLPQASDEPTLIEALTQLLRGTPKA